MGKRVNRYFTNPCALVKVDKIVGGALTLASIKELVEESENAGVPDHAYVVRYQGEGMGNLGWLFEWED